MNIFNSSYIPTELDWVGYESDLDASWSHRIFFGKSAEDVIEIFQANVVESAENIYRMPKIPFQYYLMAFARYVMSIDASISYSSSDAASALFNYVLSTLQENPSKLKDIYHELLPIIESIATSQNKYDASESIYGSFVNTKNEIAELADVIFKSVPSPSL